MKMFLAAAALLLMPSVASAKNYEIKLDGLCDLMAFQVSAPTVVGFSYRTCEAGNFVGTITTLKGGNRAVVAALVFTDQPGVPYVLQIDYPFRDGGNWTVFYTQDGTSVSPFANGTYKVWGHRGTHQTQGPRLTDAIMP